MELLHTENIDKVYRDNSVPVEALKGVTVTIEKGEFLAFAGPSGSGKTTLLNLLGALDQPTTGKVFLGNEDLSQKKRVELSDLRLHQIGFIFQAYNLIPVLTAIENIEFKMMLLNNPEKERREKALQIMDELGIKHLAHKRPNEMSGGEQQRVAIARAIVNHPPLVLADEPTANLDSVTAHNLIDLMLKMCKEKQITFIFSTHDRQLLEHAERIVILKDGRIASDEKT